MDSSRLRGHYDEHDAKAMGADTVTPSSLLVDDVPAEIITVTTTARLPWLDEFKRSIDALTVLEANWDTGGAPRIDPQTVLNATRFLVGFMAADPIAPPAVVPTHEGGIQLEWH